MINITNSIFHRKWLWLLVVVLSLYSTALQTSTAILNLKKTWKNTLNWTSNIYQKTQFSPNHASVWHRKEWNAGAGMWVIVCCGFLVCSRRFETFSSFISVCVSDQMIVKSDLSELMLDVWFALHRLHRHNDAVISSLILRRKLWGALLRYLYLDALLLLQTNKRESDFVRSGLEMRDRFCVCVLITILTHRMLLDVFSSVTRIPQTCAWSKHTRDAAVSVQKVFFIKPLVLWCIRSWTHR